MDIDEDEDDDDKVRLCDRRKGSGKLECSFDQVNYKQTWCNAEHNAQF